MSNMGLVEFDYGKDNMAIYNKEIPPLIKFTHLTSAVPIAILYGNSDAFTETKDKTWLTKTLEN